MATKKPKKPKYYRSLKKVKTGNQAKYMARWNGQKLKTTSKNVKAIKNLSLNYTFSAGDSSSAPKREKTTISFELPLAAQTLSKTIENEIKTWRSLVGKRGYFYLGNKKVASYKFNLMKVDINDVLMTNTGIIVAATIVLSFEEYRKREKKKDSKTTKATKKNASGVAKYTGGKFAWPVPGHKRISSQYGPRNCPYHGRETHSGIDIPAPTGTPVIAAAPGKVIHSGWLGSYGNAIIISHGNNLYTLYGHNSTLLVKTGKQVSKKQKIAKVGSTGNSTGPHLHFEVRKGANRHSNHVNPKSYL